MRKVCAVLALVSLLGVCSFVLAAGPAVSAAGGNHHARFFWGTVTGTVHWEFAGEVAACPDQGGFLTVSEAEGQTNHLGLTTFNEIHCARADGLPANGIAVFTAANGDELSAEYVLGSASWLPPPSEGSFAELASYTISGGTGRFANASGSFQLTVVVTPTGDPTLPGASWPIRFSAVGTIKY